MTNNLFILLLTILVLGACSKSDTDEIDTEAPTLTVEFPAPCDTIYFDQMMRFKASFTDNEAVGSYKLNIHHNFDHHTHGNHEEVCHMDDEKHADNPYLANWSVDLPAGESADVDTTFSVPANFQGGDYHVLVYVTDANGNQGWTGVSVKMMSR